MGLVIVSLALAALVSACAPRVGPITMIAIVTYESGGRAFAIDDDTAHRSYFPTRRGEAVAIARRLLSAGHTIDEGLSQVNSANFSAYGLDAESALDPCVNVATGASILRRAYAAACRRDGPGQTALRHALSAYNAGRFFTALPYARAIYRTAASLRFQGPNSRESGGRAVPFHAGRHRRTV